MKYEAIQKNKLPVTYGFAQKTFFSFTAIGEDAGNSRVFAGIHWQPSVNTGLVQGRKVATNILKKPRISFR